MKRELLQWLCCPACSGDLSLTAGETSPAGDRVISGDLRCTQCGQSYPIVKAIPRFVSADNYTGSFGYQWRKFSRTQLDETVGVPISEERFFRETGWPRSLPGEVILEAGSGMGRFTRCAASTGATVVSFDFSLAIEANYGNNHHLANIHFLQADIRRPPFRPGTFDRAYCFGVLQHTPDPEASFRSLVRFIRPGGECVCDVYRRSWKTVFWGQYYLRAITRRVPPERLFPLVEKYFRAVHAFTGALLPINSHFSKLVSLALGTADYRGLYPMTADQMTEWCLLDTFDKLSPAFDNPQHIDQVRRWADGLGASSFDVRPGYNGLEIHVRR